MLGVGVYAGTDQKTCLVANNPLCTVCEESEAICQESIDIQKYMVLLLKTLLIMVCKE